MTNAEIGNWERVAFELDARDDNASWNLGNLTQTQQARVQE